MQGSNLQEVAARSRAPSSNTLFPPPPSSSPAPAPAPAAPSRPPTSPPALALSSSAPAAAGSPQEGGVGAGPPASPLPPPFASYYQVLQQLWDSGRKNEFNSLVGCIQQKFGGGSRPSIAATGSGSGSGSGQEGPLPSPFPPRSHSDVAHQLLPPHGNEAHLDAQGYVQRSFLSVQQKGQVGGAGPQQELHGGSLTEQGQLGFRDRQGGGGESKVHQGLGRSNPGFSQGGQAHQYGSPGAQAFSMPGSASLQNRPLEQLSKSLGSVPPHLLPQLQARLMAIQKAGQGATFSHPAANMPAASHMSSAVAHEFAASGCSASGGNGTGGGSAGMYGSQGSGYVDNRSAYLAGSLQSAGPGNMSYQQNSLHVDHSERSSLTNRQAGFGELAPNSAQMGDSRSEIGLGNVQKQQASSDGHMRRSNSTDPLPSFHNPRGQVEDLASHQEFQKKSRDMEGTLGAIGQAFHQSSSDVQGSDGQSDSASVMGNRLQSPNELLRSNNVSSSTGVNQSMKPVGNGTSNSMQSQYVVQHQHLSRGGLPPINLDNSTSTPDRIQQLMQQTWAPQQLHPQHLQMQQQKQQQIMKIQQQQQQKSQQHLYLQQNEQQHSFFHPQQQHQYLQQQPQPSQQQQFQQQTQAQQVQHQPPQYQQQPQQYQQQSQKFQPQQQQFQLQPQQQQFQQQPQQLKQQEQPQQHQVHKQQEQPQKQQDLQHQDAPSPPLPSSQQHPNPPPQLQQQLSQDQQQSYGFTRQQLHVLRSQILAFRRIKRGDKSLQPELLRSITPVPLTGQTLDRPLPSDNRGPGQALQTLNHVAPHPALGPGQDRTRPTNVKPAETTKSSSVVDSQQYPSAVSKCGDGPKAEGDQKQGVLDSEQSKPVYPLKTESTDAGGHATKIVVPLNVKPVQSTSQVIAGPRSEHNPSLTASQKFDGLKTGISDVKAEVGNNKTAGDSVGQMPTASSVIQRSLQESHRRYQGPLFDYPCFGKKADGTYPSTPQPSLWGLPIKLGYNVREMLLEEGLRVVEKKRVEKLQAMDALLNSSDCKRISSDKVMRLRIEQRKLRVMDFQARIRDEVEEQQQEIMAMGERAYRKFVRLCERQRADLLRHVLAQQRAAKDKQLKSLLQWRKKLLELQWATRDSRTTRNRGVAKYHERMLREFSKKKDEDRNKRMEALKNNDVDAYREMLLKQQTEIPGDAGERFEVLSSFLSQTEEYLHKLGGKISAVKNQQEIEEAKVAATVSARAQGLSEEEILEAAVRAGEEVASKGWNTEGNTSQHTSVNKYYSLAHAVDEQILRQPSMLRAGTLRDYQLVGLQWMLSLYNNRLNGILADEMGLGKTVQVMALIAYLMEFKGNYGPHLIIVPNAVIVNWKSELLRWLPSVSCIFYVGVKDQRSKIYLQEVNAMKFNILVTTYEFIMRDRSKLSKVDWKYIIIDEAQRMKDRESRLARDLDRFRCQRRLLLTGTPLQNDLHELWSLLNLLLPEVFDNSRAFHDWFSKPFQKDGSNQTDEDDWLETEKKVIIIHRLHQILEPFMLRRRVEDVEGSLPPKVSVVLKCRMSAFQSAIYDWVKATGTIRLDPQLEAQRLAGGNSTRPARAYAPLQNKCMELRKVCNHPYLNYPPRGYQLGESAIRSCGKLWILDRILVKLHRTGHRVLLFSTMTKLLDILEEYLLWRRFAYRRIDGTTSLDGREDAIVEFNRPGSDCFIFLLSIRAAGRGLNLQSADTVVIYDPDPNPKNEEQAVARAHRIGQKREVKVLYLEAVVETIASYEKEDEVRSGGTVDDNDDDMAGKDRYMGSVESLVRNNIQQHKIDMADEVINAGRFDQRTTQEERRLTLEALLHDEERYQETVHDVPSMQEVNRLIARSSEEVEIFDQMDEECDWPGELLKHQQVPKWLRVGSQEVNAAIAATSKRAQKKGFVGTIGTREAEEKMLAKAAKAKRKGHQGQKEPVITAGDGVPSKFNWMTRGKRKREMEEVVIEEEFEEDSYQSPTDVVMFEEEEEEGEIVGAEEEELSDEAVDMNEEGEIDEEAQVEAEDEQVRDVEESEEAFEQEVGEEVETHEDAAANVSSDDGDTQWEGSYNVNASGHGADDQVQRFGMPANLESNPLRQELGEDLEEGEIAGSGDSSAMRSESWMQGGDDGEHEQLFRPQRKNKRTKRIRNQSFVDPGNNKIMEVCPAVPVQFPPMPAAYAGQGILPGPTFVSHIAPDDMYFERNDQWGAAAYAKRRHSLFPGLEEGMPEPLANQRPRLLFKHSLSNGFQEPMENMFEAGDPRNMKGILPGPPTWGSLGGRMPESTQKKCKAALKKLQGAVNAALFMELPKVSVCPDYYNIISRPVDVHTIEERLDHFGYGGVLDFAADVQLMLDNAVRYHATSAEVQSDARRLQIVFFQRMQLMFPDVDFSSVKTKMAPLPAGGRKRGNDAKTKGPADTSPSGTWSSGQKQGRQQHQGFDADDMDDDDEPPVIERDSKGQILQGKKKKGEILEVAKSFKEKKRPMTGRPDCSRSLNSVQEPEEELTRGVVHPLDLVIQKKKRNNLRRGSSRDLSQLDRRKGESSVDATPSSSNRRNHHQSTSSRRQGSFEDGREGGGRAGSVTNVAARSHRNTSAVQQSHAAGPTRVGTSSVPSHEPAAKVRTEGSLPYPVKRPRTDLGASRRRMIP